MLGQGQVSLIKKISVFWVMGLKILGSTHILEKIYNFMHTHFGKKIYNFMHFERHFAFQNA